MAFNFGFSQSRSITTEIDLQFDLSVALVTFCDWYIKDLYQHILTDCYNKSAGLSEKDDTLFWDSVVTTEQPKGLITLLADAMVRKHKVYLSYKNGVVAQATQAEQVEMEKGPQKGFAICDFGGFVKTDLLRVCALMLYSILQTGHTGLKVSSALQIKIENLRTAIAENNAEEAIKQAKVIAAGIKAGKGVMVSGGDSIVLPQFDTNPMQESLSMINGLAANFMGGFPLSYVNGALGGGLASTGEADDTAINRALKYYFNSIFRPVVKALTGSNIKFKEDNWRKLSAVASLLPTLEMSTLVDDDIKTAFVKEALNG